MTVVINKMILISLILIQAFILYFFYLQWYPFEVVELETFKIVNTQIQKNEPIHLYMKFDKKLNYKAEINWYIVDGVTYKLNESSIIKPVGKNDYHRYFTFPKSLNAGTYKLHADIIYTISPFRKIIYNWESNSFTVL